MRGCTPQGGWLGSCAEIRFTECAPQTSGLPGRRREFPSPNARRKLGGANGGPWAGLNHLQTSPPTGPEIGTRQPTRAGSQRWEAQATWRVLLENRIVGDEGRGSPPAAPATGPKTGGLPKRKGRRKRELIMVATMISRMIGTPCVFQIGPEFPVTTAA